MLVLLILCRTCLPVFPGPVVAQDVQRVAAVVNDDLVSLHDLEQRTKLALLTSNLADTPEVRSRILPQLLRRLIDERLELQEAQKLKLTVTSAEVTSAMATIEQQNNMRPGGFEALLTGKGVDPDAMRQQLRAELAWSDVVHAALMRDVHISQEAVEARLAALRANLGKPEYLAAEIYLAVDNIKSEGEVRSLAERLIEQMRQGAPFSALAQQFSQTGAGGGNLGWVSEGLLDEDLLKALARLESNTVSPPIRATDGYHILLLLEKRRIGEGLSTGPTVDLLTVETTILPGTTAAERDQQMRHLHEILAPARNCDELVKLSKEVPTTATNLAEKVALLQLPPQIHDLIANLQPGQISTGIDSPKWRRFFAVCGKNDNAGGLPSSDDIRRRMEDEQLEILARRRLRDLRRDAFVEIRM
jgi:peptidyl-prolyl cis-trans isomerase SurA